MTQPERHARFLAETEELYAAIGRFAVHFEHVCHAMQLAVGQLLHMNGLRHGGLTNAVLSGLTADPMLSIFRASIVEARKGRMTAADTAILKNVVSRIRKLIEVRNDVLHRTWFVGWAAPSDEDFSSVTGWKHKNTSQGAEFRPVDFTKADFDTHSVEADALTGIVNRMAGCLLLDRSFASNFDVDQDGTVRVPAST